MPNNIVRRFRFTNNKKEWKRFAKELDGNCKVALEATGNASMIYDILTGHGAQVVVALTHPHFHTFGSREGNRLNRLE